MKQILTGLLAFFLLAGCGNSTAAVTPSASSAAETTAAAVKSDDPVLSDYLNASAEDLKTSYVLENGTMSPWSDAKGDDDALQLNDLVKDAISKGMDEISEDQISDDQLLFEFQPGAGEVIYLYVDGNVKSIGIGTRHFYHLKDDSIIAQVQAYVESLQSKAA